MVWIVCWRKTEDAYLGYVGITGSEEKKAEYFAPARACCGQNARFCQLKWRFNCVWTSSLSRRAQTGGSEPGSVRVIAGTDLAWASHHRVEQSWTIRVPQSGPVTRTQCHSPRSLALGQNQDFSGQNRQGAAGRDRTHDTTRRGLLLYQLDQRSLITVVTHDPKLSRVPKHRTSRQTFLARTLQPHLLWQTLCLSCTLNVVPARLTGRLCIWRTALCFVSSRTGEKGLKILCAAYCMSATRPPAPTTATLRYRRRTQPQPV